MLLAVVMSIAMLAVGCGGSGGDHPGGSLFTKVEFIRQANAACERERAGLMERISDFERRRPSPPLPGADMVHLVYLPTIERQVWRIEELGVPRGETGPIEAMLDAEGLAIDAVAVIPKVLSIAATERYFATADRLFRAYGLPFCATGN